MRHVGAAEAAQDLARVGGAGAPAGVGDLVADVDGGGEPHRGVARQIDRAGRLPLVDHAVAVVVDLLRIAVGVLVDLDRVRPDQPTVAVGVVVAVSLVLRVAVAVVVVLRGVVVGDSVAVVVEAVHRLELARVGGGVVVAAVAVAGGPAVAVQVVHLVDHAVAVVVDLVARVGCAREDAAAVVVAVPLVLRVAVPVEILERGGAASPAPRRQRHSEHPRESRCHGHPPSRTEPYKNDAGHRCAKTPRISNHYDRGAAPIWQLFGRT